MADIFKGRGPSWEYPDMEPIDLDLGMKSGVNIDWDVTNISRPFTFRLDSECCASVTYNPILQYLFIEFTDGSGYEYANVPPWIALDLVQSSSAGRYFNYQIRNNYPFEQIYWR